MKGNIKMNLLNLFKKKKKIKSGVCFSNQKSVEELKKNFLETYTDRINAVTVENGEKLTEKTKDFILS